tara:strand:+ start:1147 stop:1488 length:342 start_codon:yes stop_codon:yes gene_type:complete
MLCSISVSGVHRPILPKKHSISHRGYKIVMKNSKCPDSNPKSLDDVYVETMKKMYQPAIEPIIEQLSAIDEKIVKTDNLLNDINSKLIDIIDIIDKTNNYSYVEGICETNDVY